MFIEFFAIACLVVSFFNMKNNNVFKFLPRNKLNMKKYLELP
jgi:hypothetical protein